MALQWLPETLCTCQPLRLLREREKEYYWTQYIFFLNSQINLSPSQQWWLGDYVALTLEMKIMHAIPTKSFHLYKVVTFRYELISFMCKMNIVLKSLPEALIWVSYLLTKTLCKKRWCRSLRSSQQNCFCNGTQHFKMFIHHQHSWDQALVMGYFVALTTMNSCCSSWEPVQKYYFNGWNEI